MSQLQQLESRMAQLIAWRNARLQWLEREVTQTNREFDEKAIPLGREIQQLREQEQASKPETITSGKQSRRSSVSFTGLTTEEIEHVKALQERTR